MYKYKPPTLSYYVLLQVTVYPCNHVKYIYDMITWCRKYSKTILVTLQDLFVHNLFIYLLLCSHICYIKAKQHLRYILERHVIYITNQKWYER